MPPLPLTVAQDDFVAGGFLVLWAGMLLLSAANLGLLVWAIVDRVQNRSLTDNERIVWTLVVIFVGCIGPILYLVIGRNKPPTPRPLTEPDLRSF